MRQNNYPHVFLNNFLELTTGKYNFTTIIMKNNKNHALSMFFLTPIFFLYGFYNNAHQTLANTKSQIVDERTLNIRKMAQINVAFDLIEGIYYENDSAKLSGEEFVALVKKDKLLSQFVNALDTSFKLDQTAKELIDKVIVKDTYLNLRQADSRINSHRNELLSIRYWLVEKLFSKNLSVQNMISMYAKETHHIKEKLKNRYEQIKKHEAPITQKIKRTILRRMTAESTIKG